MSFFNNRVRAIYWILVVVIVSYLVLQRYSDISRGHATPVDIGLVLIWIALLLIPLFQEVDIFGVRFRREIDSLKTEVGEKFVDLKSEIQQTIGVHSQINPQFYLGQPPPDSQLPAMEKVFKGLLKDALKEEGKKTTTKMPKLSVPETATLSFSIRYEIEKELRRIAEKHIGLPIESETSRGFLISPGRTARKLARLEIINPATATVIEELLPVVNSGIHGRDISDDKISFIKDVSPSLIKYLKGID